MFHIHKTLVTFKKRMECMRKYVGFIILLSGCASKQEPFQLEDYGNFCPSEVRISEESSKEYIVYKSEEKDFYILPGDYILSRSELLRMPQNNTITNNEKSVKISSPSDFSNYLNDQIEDIKKIGINFKDGVSKAKTNYPDKKLAKELVVEKYISTKNPGIIFCGLTLKSDFSPMRDKYTKYIIKQHEEKKPNNDIYSGERGSNYFNITPYYK